MQRRCVQSPPTSGLPLQRSPLKVLQLISITTPSATPPLEDLQMLFLFHIKRASPFRSGSILLFSNAIARTTTTIITILYELHAVQNITIIWKWTSSASKNRTHNDLVVIIISLLIIIPMTTIIMEMLTVLLNLEPGLHLGTILLMITTNNNKSERQPYLAACVMTGLPAYYLKSADESDMSIYTDSHRGLLRSDFSALD